jgi:stress-induced morphogen
MQINGALEDELKTIHALSIRQCWTPEQQQKAQSK